MLSEDLVTKINQLLSVRHNDGNVVEYDVYDVTEDTSLAKAKTMGTKVKKLSS